MTKSLNDPPMTFAEAQTAVALKPFPRVTAEAMKDAILGVDYLSHGLTTVCIIVLHNGFKFVGHSTPADARNYDADIGKSYAYDNAFRQMWSHFGFMLRDRLVREERDARGEQTPRYPPPPPTS